MLSQSLYHTYKRYRTLQTHRISALPLVILMPHSACNCRCVMCDIWKGNRNLKQLTREDIAKLMGSFLTLGTQQVLMSGGEALLNPMFFQFCKMLDEEGIGVSLLSTGLTIKQHAADISRYVNDIVVSVDGDEALHDRIRNIPGAFKKMKDGIAALRTIDPSFPITGRCVIHKLNFKHWHLIVEAAMELGLDGISFLPADVSSSAFNRETAWDPNRQADVQIPAEELPALDVMIEYLEKNYAQLFKDRFIAESPEKIKKIASYYSALQGKGSFPYKKCNAPWVSVVVEADGNVRPCFFHDRIGNIHKDPLDHILNSKTAMDFRKGLDMNKNETCIKCVCYLHLSPSSSIS